MLFYSLILIFYLLFAWLAFRNIRYGLYLILLFLPSYQIRYQIFGLPITLLEGMVWLLFVIWLIKIHKEQGLTFNPLIWIKNLIQDTRYRIQGTKNPIPREFRLPIILLLAAATISVFTSPNLQSALGVWKAYFIEALLIFIVFFYNIRTLKHIKHAIRILGVLTIIIGLFAIYQKLTGAFIPNPFWANAATRRVTTFFGYPNANALLLVPIIFLTIGNALTDFSSSIAGFGVKIINFTSWKKLFFNLLVLICGVLTIIWTDSSGALIAIIAGLICLALFYKKTRVITVIVLAAIFIIAFSQTKTINYLKDGANSLVYSDLPLSPSDLQIRYQQWKETINLIIDAPIFGAGLSGYQTLMIPYHQFWHIEIFLYPHNFFLNFWTETGLLGLIAIIWIIVIFFIIGYQTTSDKQRATNNERQTTSNTLTLCTICAMIVLIVHGLVDVPYFKNDLSIMFWVIVGIMIILKNSKSETLNTKQFQNSNDLNSKLF